MTAQEIQEIFARRRAEKRWQNRVWICVALSLLAFVISLADRYVSAVQQKTEQAVVRQENEFTRNRIEAEIDRILESYGVKKDWIHKRAVKLSKQEFVRYEEYVSLPPDIPVVDLNLDLSTMVKKYDARAVAIEDLKNGTVAVHIIVKGNVLQSVLQSINPELKRDVGAIALMIDNIENASDEALNALLRQSNERFALGLTPNRKTAELFHRIADAGKELFLVITIRSEDNRDLFALSSDLNETKVKWRLAGILTEFDKAAGCFVISDKPKPTAVDIIQREMERRHLIFLQMSDVRYVQTRLDSAQIALWLQGLAGSAIQEKGVIGVIPWESNLASMLENEVRALRKRGFTFISVSTSAKQKVENKS
jgi:hypothetical protein